MIMISAAAPRRYISNGSRDGEAFFDPCFRELVYRVKRAG